jgi:transketolase
MSGASGGSVFDVVFHVARSDPAVVFIGSDIAPGLLSEMRRELPDQYFMEGIQEQHLIGMAAGMALEGLKPVVSTIATFLVRRCFEQVLIDAALHRLPITLLGTGPGLAYAALGPTHCCVDDFALLRTVPGMHIVAPSSMSEANALLAEGLARGCLMYLRVPRGDEVPLPPGDWRVALGVPIMVRRGSDAVIVCTGGLAGQAAIAAGQLAADGIDVGVVHVHTIKPLDPAALLPLIGDARLVVTVEEHLRSGGLGSAVLEALADARSGWPGVVRLGLADEFVAGYGTHEQALAAACLTAPGIVSAARGWWYR